MTTLLMALAGGLGAGSRWSVDAWLRPRVSGRLPWPTLLINVTGSFLLGLLVGLATDSTWLTILGTGFLGGYTTFSTASVETVQLAIGRRYAAAAANALVMLVLSVAAAACGWILVR
ncbi:fluoride efflux transporter FluC [Aeromicrobium chenweiae]|uniref:Fluoride-specific ion channel FluC n=1 Tax=Aeromicrobium chenweiae TaxID=2079793 RepID=A0A2S0WJW9_9ACTN|nr:CrcB family protein [Aeromicrobium chenweiae]AWB91639.1 chromosome condensation protein CrcB [Aeromicrobium chenweiae]TGN32479.1 CrcB family protein [Aeromicrobium chenweiae]